MTRDHGGWRQQQQQQQRRREPGITVSLHPRDVTKYLYPAIIHCSGRTQQPCVIQYQSSPVLPSELSAPPQHSNIQQKSDLLTPGLPHSHYHYTYCTVYILYCWELDFPSSVNLHRIARMLDRPGLRPGCDTEALAGEFLLLYLWWNAFSGSRGVGTRALQHSGIWAERGGEVMLWTFPSYSSLCAHRSSQQWTVTFWY